MKLPLLTFTLSAISFYGFTQELQQPQLGITLDSISQIARRTDSLIKLHKREFVVATNVNNRVVQEKWKYAYLSRHLVFLQISYHSDSAYFEEDYHISDGFLLFSEEKHIHYMPHVYGSQESGHWMEECYFIKNNLIHEISHGHGITESDNYDPEKAVLARFNKRIKKLKQQMPTMH